jgi:hypothetical protein
MFNIGPENQAVIMNDRSFSAVSSRLQSAHHQALREGFDERHPKNSIVKVKPYKFENSYLALPHCY